MVRKRKKLTELNNISASDRLIWQAYTAGVQPLNAYTDKYANLVPLTRDLDNQHRSLKSEFSSALMRVPYIEPYLPPLVSKHLSTVSAFSAKRIKQPEVIDGQLDLHGLTRIEAYNVVIRFVDSHYQRHNQTLLIITGKGFMRPHDSERLSLAEILPQWLSQSPLSDYVRAFTTAHIKHGGRGAYYVHLKKPV